MNIFLWILQALLALAFIGSGYNKAFNTEKAKTQQGMQWMNRIPNGLLTFIGFSEILGGLGLLLPALTGILPQLTLVAAAALALVMVLAIFVHLPHREIPNIVINLVLFALATFIVYGRWVIAPL